MAKPKSSRPSPASIQLALAQIFRRNGYVAEQWTAAIASVLQEAGYEPVLAVERAQEAIIQIEGALVLAIATDQKELFQQTLERLPGRLLNSI